MKKLLWAVLGIALVISLAVGIMTNTESGQNFLFDRATNAAFGQPPEPITDLRVVVCGSASPLGNDPSRAQACIAVLTPEHFFLVDVGARSPTRIAAARMPLRRLDGILVTHYHSDHIASIPDVNLASWVQGRPAPLNVFGPAGVSRVVEGFNIAYELDRSYRTAHHGADMLPPENGFLKAQPFEPGEVVWQDELMTVTSFPVQHPPIEPAVGYRFDYRGRSVVISGDTNASDDLFAAAKDADIVFHDALSRTLLDPMIRTTSELNVPVIPRIMEDVIDYHADTQTLAGPSAEAGVGLLVFYHLVPVPPPFAFTEDMFKRGLPDDVILAHDLQTFDLPRDSSEIIVRD